jgi:hypothetical protein
MTLSDTLKAYGKHNGRWIVLMCHSSLSVEEQEKVRRERRIENKEKKRRGRE